MGGATSLRVEKHFGGLEGCNLVAGREIFRGAGACNWLKVEKRGEWAFGGFFSIAPGGN